MDNSRSYEPSTVLVTGGAGFIGSHLVERLLQRGTRVVVFDNYDAFYSRERKGANLAAVAEHPALTVVEGDIRERNALDKAFSVHAPDAVVHLAARAGVRASVGQASLYTDINVIGTLNLLEVASQAHVRNFIFGSSSSVYAGNDVPFREESNADRPVSPYAATKRAGELLAHTYSHLYALPVTCLRFFSVYGPRLRPDLAIYKFARLIARGDEVPIYGDGSAKRDCTYVDDIVEGIVAALGTPRPYEIINLGDARTIPVSRIVALLEEHLGAKARCVFYPPNPSDAVVTYADITKARRLLGYEPKVPFEEGIARFVRWFREQDT